MRLNRSLLGVVTLLAAASSAAPASRADTSLLPAAKLKAKPVVAFTAQPFPLDSVRLLDGPFKAAL